MNHKYPIRAWIALAIVLCGGVAMAEKPAPSVELDPRCTRLPLADDFVPGQLVELADGSLLTIRGAATAITATTARPGPRRGRSRLAPGRDCRARPARC